MFVSSSHMNSMNSDKAIIALCAKVCTLCIYLYKNTFIIIDINGKCLKDIFFDHNHVVIAHAHIEYAIVKKLLIIALLSILFCCSFIIYIHIYIYMQKTSEMWNYLTFGDIIYICIL